MIMPQMAMTYKYNIAYKKATVIWQSLFCVLIVRKWYYLRL